MTASQKGLATVEAQQAKDRDTIAELRARIAELEAIKADLEAKLGVSIDVGEKAVAVGFCRSACMRSFCASRLRPRR